MVIDGISSPFLFETQDYIIELFENLNETGILRTESESRHIDLG
jgi:hypothetical protein